MAAMRFKQVQRFILAKKIWGVRGTLIVRVIMWDYAISCRTKYFVYHSRLR